MTLSHRDLAKLITLRHHLHQRPEISGQEYQTAAFILKQMQDLGADQIITGIAQTGLVAIFHGARPGPKIMFRAELDALPITEQKGPEYRSQSSGVAHLCGHDGHMVVLVALARMLARQRPKSGQVILLFQPAEETGAGAAAMLADPLFAQIQPDWGFALHNFPGLPIGHASLIPGPVNCASMGMKVTFNGATSHASEPEKARSPALSLSEIIPALLRLSQGKTHDPAFKLVTITHLNMGNPAFGITPGKAELWATLRSLDDVGMADLRTNALDVVSHSAQKNGLCADVTWHDHFAASHNNPKATTILQRAAITTGLTIGSTHLPMRASEDFGRFGSIAKTAMLFLGAGRDHPPLHAENYDFPDDLIAIGAQLFHQVIGDLTE